MRTRGRGGLIACRCPQLSITLRLAMLVCSCMAFLVTPTVMAVAVLNGPLRLLDVCCLWLLECGMKPMHQSEVSQPQAIHLWRPTHCLYDVCRCEHGGRGGVSQMRTSFIYGPLMVIKMLG